MLAPSHEEAKALINCVFPLLQTKSDANAQQSTQTSNTQAPRTRLLGGIAELL